MTHTTGSPQRKPKWLTTRLPAGQGYARVSQRVREGGLHTICASGRCPNLAECWAQGTATFLILGDTCTRSCRFCATATGQPALPSPDEPARVAHAVRALGIAHCVITSVTRDDLPDEGAGHWQRTIAEVKRVNPTIGVEALIPDFNGSVGLINIALAAAPHVVAHNMETVERLTPQVRSRARFAVSLAVLERAAALGFTTKSGLMLGLGETRQEIIQALRALRSAGCSIVTLGQYLQPRRDSLGVARYIPPHEFEELGQIARGLGFGQVASGPLVRSSYHAGALASNALHPLAPGVSPNPLQTAP